jgi:hypothetical protein
MLSAALVAFAQAAPAQSTAKPPPRLPPPPSQTSQIPGGVDTGTPGGSDSLQMGTPVMSNSTGEAAAEGRIGRGTRRGAAEADRKQRHCTKPAPGPNDPGALAVAQARPRRPDVAAAAGQPWPLPARPASTARPGRRSTRSRPAVEERERRLARDRVRVNWVPGTEDQRQLSRLMRPHPIDQAEAPLADLLVAERGDVVVARVLRDLVSSLTALRRPRAPAGRCARWCRDSTPTPTLGAPSSAGIAASASALFTSAARHAYISRTSIFGS